MKKSKPVFITSCGDSAHIEVKKKVRVDKDRKDFNTHWNYVRKKT